MGSDGGEPGPALQSGVPYGEYAHPAPPPPMCLPEPADPPPPRQAADPVEPCTNVADLTHEEKMRRAIESAMASGAIGEEVLELLPELQDFINMILTVAAALILLGMVAGTGVGAIASGVVGLAFLYWAWETFRLSAEQIGVGAAMLVEFFDATRCDKAQTPEDLEAAGETFARGISRVGVGTVMAILSYYGARGGARMVRGAGRTLASRPPLLPRRAAPAAGEPAVMSEPPPAEPAMSESPPAEPPQGELSAPRRQTPPPPEPPPPEPPAEPIPPEELARRRALGQDPASGRFRPAEEEAALRREERAGPLERDPSGTGDWVDASGRTYDAVGPVPPGRLNLQSFIRQIDRHLLKQGLDYVVLDLTNFSAADRAAVLSHIRGLSPAEQARIIVQP
jgi:hypothetical protein